MKISKVEALLMSFPFPQKLELPFWGGRRTILKRDAMLIRISTNTGLKGFAPGPAHIRAQKEIRDVIAPFLVGKDPLKWKQFGFKGNREICKTYRAVEIALLDLVSKFEGCPISDLLGGRKREKIKLYGSAGMYMSAENYAMEALGVRELGFSAYKFRPAMDPEGNLEILENIRRATGDDMALMIDAHSWWRMGVNSYTPEMVTGLARDMQFYKPYWLEEPMLPDDHIAYVKLNREGIVPIASGEHEQDLDGFRDLIEKRAVGFVQMDVCCQGGYLSGLEIMDLAGTNGLKFAFHCWGTLLEVLVAAHLGICRESSVVEWLEYPCYSNQGRTGMYPFPLSDEILDDEPEIENGDLIVPNGTGLGIGINERVVEKYPFIPGPWSYFHLDSPQKTIAVTGDHSLKGLTEVKGKSYGKS